MKNIEAVYDSYAPVVNFFGRDRIQQTIEEMTAKAETFLKSEQGAREKALYVQDMLVAHTVMDYFTDIKRLREFHPVDGVNSYKSTGYMVYWWLRRKPIQIPPCYEEKFAFINEKFAISLIHAFLIEAGMQSEQNGGNHFSAFYDSLYYYLKYRQYTAQDIEMILLSLRAGGSVSFREQ